MRRVLVLSIGAILAAAVFAPSAFASHRLVVDNDRADCPNADFTSIQAAVTAADPGTRILICRGRYTEEVVIATAAKNGLQLIGRGPRDQVILDGVLGVAAPTGYNGIELSNVMDVVLRGFTVTGFHENIYLLPGANGNTVKHMIARGPSAHDGIRLDNAHGNEIEHNLVFRNGVPPRGCGIDLLVGAGTNRIHHNRLFEQDRAGIRLLGAGTGNVVSHNDSERNGNGVFIQNTNGTVVEHNDLEENFAQGDQRGVGIRMLTTAGTTRLNVVRHNEIEDNQSDGIALENVHDNTIAKNESEENGRDGIFANSVSAGNTIEKNEMEDNVEHDCHDDSVGPFNPPALVANQWIRNEGETENRPGLCRDGDDGDDDDDDDDGDDDD
jgi:parallel beta-helix repeat protein